MKKLFTLILFIAWALTVNGQVVRDSTYLADSIEIAENYDQLQNCHGCLIAVEGTDALGNKDTVYIGSDSMATVGLNPQFEEINLINRPLKPMDLRLIQRNEICLHYFTIGDNTPFPEATFLRFRQNLELKKDIRSSWKFLEGADSYTASSVHYALKVQTSNYPISFRIIQIDGNGTYNRFNRELGIEFRGFVNCRNINPFKRISSIQTLDTIQFNTPRDHFWLNKTVRIISSVKRNKSKLALEAYPIPATNKIQITGLRSATSVSITSIAGKQIKNVFVNPESPEVDIEGLEKGIYILYCQSKEGVQALRIVKQ